jgi:hypothetical protein
MIVDGIAADGYYVYAFLGIPPQPSGQWNRYLSLSSLATNEELVVLTKHAIPTVRCYSFLSLVKREDPRICEVLQRLLSDTAEVSTVAGCIVVRKSVRDVCNDIVGRRTLANCLR